MLFHDRIGLNEVQFQNNIEPRKLHDLKYRIVIHT